MKNGKKSAKNPEIWVKMWLFMTLISGVSAYDFGSKSVFM